MPSLDPDLIRSALATPAPETTIAGKVGTSHWRTVCTVYTETGESFLVTGYDPTRPRLSECTAAVPVELTSIYDVIERQGGTKTLRYEITEREGDRLRLTIAKRETDTLGRPIWRRGAYLVEVVS